MASSYYEGTLYFQDYDNAIRCMRLLKSNSLLLPSLIFCNEYFLDQLVNSYRLDIPYSVSGDGVLGKIKSFSEQVQSRNIFGSIYGVIHSEKKISGFTFGFAEGLSLIDLELWAIRTLGKSFDARQFSPDDQESLRNFRMEIGEEYLNSMRQVSQEFTTRKFY